MFLEFVRKGGGGGVMNNSATAQYKRHTPDIATTQFNFNHIQAKRHDAKKNRQHSHYTNPPQMSYRRMFILTLLCITVFIAGTRGCVSGPPPHPN